MKNEAFSDILSGVSKIGFFGLGRSNLSLLKTLPLSGVEVVLRSEGKIPRSLIPLGIKPERIYEGNFAFSDIDEDILLLSPSVRRERAELEEARGRLVRFSSDAELFFERVGSRPVFGVSGSDGKSTTATLAHALLSEGRRASLIGNIGAPMLESLLDGSECFSAELSSFMLRYLSPKLRRGAITSITPNHLNWHESFSEYIETKLSVLSSADEGVASADGDMLSYLPRGEYFALTSAEHSFEELKNRVKCNLYFTYDGEYIRRNGEAFLSVGDIRRREIHNIKNLMTAIALTDGFASRERILTVSREFSGLVHRAELFLTHGGVDYINSSIDTTPERTRATLTSLGRRCILILCGRGKGLSYGILAEAVAKYCSLVIITGEDSEAMLRELSGAARCEVRDDFDSAVRSAVMQAECGEAVLLSPAATSYDAFGSFEERGEKFKETVRALVALK